MFRVNMLVAQAMVDEADLMSQAQLMSGAKSWVSSALANFIAPATQQAILLGAGAPAAALGMYATQRAAHPRIMF